MTYDELLSALAVFGLGRRVTFKELKARHHELVKQHHPDCNTDSTLEAIQQINAAYTLLSQYINDYRFSFDEAEFYEQNPEERLRRQFMDSSMWGSG